MQKRAAVGHGTPFPSSCPPHDTDMQRWAIGWQQCSALSAAFGKSLDLFHRRGSASYWGAAWTVTCAGTTGWQKPLQAPFFLRQGAHSQLLFWYKSSLKTLELVSSKHNYNTSYRRKWGKKNGGVKRNHLAYHHIKEVQQIKRNCESGAGDVQLGSQLLWGLKQVTENPSPAWAN